MPFEHECGRLRKAASHHDVTIFFRKHAEIELAKDGIEKIDVANMLCRCVVTLVETNHKRGEDEWRAEGADSDGRRIAAEVVLYDEDDPPAIKVITGWAGKKR